MVSDLKKKKKVPDTNAVHPQSRQRNVNTIVDDGGGADSNDGKLSFPAHERVLRGKLLCARLDRWSVNHREVNAHRNIHSHKCRLCPLWFVMGVCVSVCVRTVSLCIQQLKMRLHCKSLDGKNDCQRVCFLQCTTISFFSGVSLHEKTENCVRSVCC